MNATAVCHALTPALKTAAGAAIAILAAGLLGLSSPMTAGIVAVLSIRTTKKETWRMAVEKLAAYLCALACAFAAFNLLGYTLTGFAAYLFCYAVICIAVKWEHALTPVSVLITHFVLAGGMPLDLVINEALLLLVGVGTGMLINLTLRPDAVRMDAMLTDMDGQMVAALHALADDPAQDAPFEQLNNALNNAAAMAERNRANRLLGYADTAAVYVQVRRRQYDVLLQMRQAMQSIDAHPRQYDVVCRLLHDVADQYHRDNDVEALLNELAELLQTMRRDALPASRDEFESRAVLYTVLLRLEDFLRIKRVYMAAQGKR